MMLIDFDGTIVDLWARYHAVFCRLTGAQIDQQQYKVAKQQYKRDEDLARYFGLLLPSDYFTRKALLLEDPQYLALDRLLLPGEKLLRFMAQQDAKILTARRYPENLLWELNNLGLSALQNRVICTNEPKVKWVAAHAAGKGYIIGDDVRDLQTITVSNLDSVMVQTGLCTPADFSKTGLRYELVQTLEEFIDRG